MIDKVFKPTRSNSYIIFYILSGVVSLVGVNIHFGVTLYLSRLFIALFLIGLLTKFLLRGSNYHIYINKLAGIFVAIFMLILIQHFMSVFFSERVYEGIRQLLIYASVMTLFIIIVAINIQTTTIIKGLKIFLAIGFFQACYGLYQVLGGPFGWPTFQSIIFWPTSNDKTVDGLLFSGVYGVFRPTGFFPGDVNHYASYMASIVMLALSFMMIDAKSKYLKIVFFTSFVALILSLSRSGAFSLIIFGLPAFFFLTLKLKLLPKKNFSRFLQFLFALIIILIFFGNILLGFIGIDISFLGDILIRRLNDLIHIGVDNQGSMQIHILTKLLALDAFASNPFFGVGLGVNALPWFSSTYNANWTGSHSHHLDILGQTGLLGALLEWIFILLVSLYMWRGLKLKNAPADERILLASLLAIFILIIFGNFLYHYFLNDYVWYFLATGTALSRAMLIKYSNI